MIFEKPDVIVKRWTKDRKEAYVWDNLGLTTYDKVQLQMCSGRTIICPIDSLEPLWEARTDTQKKQTYHRGKYAWKVVLGACQYV